MFFLCSALRKCKGKRQRKTFLEQDWCFTIEREDTVFPESLLEKNSVLNERRLVSCSKKYLTKENFIKKLAADKVEVRGQMRSLKEYSNRYQRRLEEQQLVKCHSHG